MLTSFYKQQLYIGYVLGEWGIQAKNLPLERACNKYDHACSKGSIEIAKNASLFTGISKNGGILQKMYGSEVALSNHVYSSKLTSHLEVQVQSRDEDQSRRQT